MKKKVGSGSAGAVVANRLSENANWKVLLLEAGGSESIISDIPVLAAALQLTPIDWAYQTQPQQSSCFGLVNKKSLWPRGKVLGGSSVLNYMLYVRGNPRDYDQWAESGAYGWSWKEVLPYFLKSEDNRDKNVVNNGYHNTGGYLTVETSSSYSPLSRAFVEAGKHFGYPEVDINGPIQAGFTLPQGTTRLGTRCSASKAFLNSAKDRPNLDIVTFAYATKLLFDQHKKVIAVQFDQFSLTHVVRVRKEVIVSAGSINSPQLLMLSGIGPAKHLKSLGIPVIADLPVGQNLQDHIYPGGAHFTVNQKSLVLKRIFTIPNFIEYFTRGRGKLQILFSYFFTFLKYFNFKHKISC